MDNKYYTPTIEEFHVGFEYEYQEFDSIKWKKDIFKEGQCPDGEEQRVKYLDQKDIESLGWVNNQYVPERNICLNFEFELNKDWSLTYWFGKIPYIEIDKDGYDTGCSLNVKNKSELMKLMQQLNIK